MNDEKSMEQLSKLSKRSPTNSAMNSEGKPKNFRKTLRNLLRYMKEYKIGLFLVVLFALGSTCFSIAGPKIMGQITTLIAEGLSARIMGTGGMDFDRIFRIVVILICLYGVSALFSFIQGWLMTGISQKVTFRIRGEMSRKINHLPMQYYDSRTYGEVLSRITNDVDTLGMNLNQSVTQLLTSVTTMIGVFIMMVTISPLMTLITMFVLPLSLIFMGGLVKISQKYFKQQQEYLGHVNGHVEEMFAGQNIVRVYNREEQAFQEFRQINGVLYESAWKSQFLSGLMQPVMTFVGNLGYVAVVVAGGFLTIQGTIQVGDILSFVQYVKQFTQPVTQIAQAANMLQAMAASAERVFEFLEEEEQDVNESEKMSSDIRDFVGHVSFKEVSFGYKKNQPVIRNFNAEITQGQKIAIVGPTGAGKTTIVKLLMRFYDVDHGQILIDGQDIRQYDRSCLRKAFGMVLQDTWLFKGTIMENIRYGRLEATDEEVIEAAKAAHVHKFIQTLPGGYQMELNEEVNNISQGQKQLLTIARAILADRKIMILDEATSSVDTRTEVRIQKAMDNLMRGRTSFIIAHRLSTIRDADLILVMKDGDIVEQGNHKQLMDQDGFYAKLYNSQFEISA